MTLKQKLDAMFNSYNTLFNKGIGTAVTYWNHVAMEVISSGSEEVYAWLDDYPMMREWIGERAVKELKENGYSIRNKEFESTVSVSRATINDDQYGIYGPMMQKMGESASQWVDDLVFGLFPKGFTETCYDGKPFFATNHQMGGKVYSNRSNKPLTLESYKEARTAMMSYCNDVGTPMNIVPNLLVVPPALEEMARRILKSDFLTTASGTESNPWKDTAEILVVPRLANHPKKWYLLQTNGILRPFIFQNRQAPDFQAITDPNSESVFKTNQFTYGTYARGNSGFGFWQQAFGSTGE